MARSESYDKIVKYSVTAKCTEPLHVGSVSGDTEEILVHPVTGNPFIQATSIAGVFREYYEQVYGELKAEELFGSRRFRDKTDIDGEENADCASKVRFTDGIFCKKNPMLELRPRVSIDHETGTCLESTDKQTKRKSGQKFNMAYISAKAEFEFDLYLFGADQQQKIEIEDIFSAFHQGVLQLGGQKSNGCGYFEITCLLYKEFDMKRESDRKLWIREDKLTKNDYKNLTNMLNKNSKLKDAYEILVDGYTEGSLLIKSIAVSGGVGAGAPDSENIRNGNGDYIIPGSSFKGAVRAQLEQILAYLKCSKLIEKDSDLIEEAFGKKGDDKTIGCMGNLYFFDVPVGTQEDNDMMPLSHRIHIDKFTGGVIHGGLFAERNIAGKMTLKISVKSNKEEEKTNQVCGLLMMALRDLAIGAMSIGSGYSVGKGIVTVEKITIKKAHEPEQKAIIDLKQGRTSDPNGVIKMCLMSLQKG